ncbi:hypothetical protein GPALN_011010 [Globodera pallida]|nr:hypothetical protein GPALN_011010 [Globodera pallida]
MTQEGGGGADRPSWSFSAGIQIGGGILGNLIGSFRANVHVGWRNVRTFLGGAAAPAGARAAATPTTTTAQAAATPTPTTAQAAATTTPTTARAAEVKRSKSGKVKKTLQLHPLQQGRLHPLQQGRRRLNADRATKRRKVRPTLMFVTTRRECYRTISTQKVYPFFFSLVTPIRPLWNPMMVVHYDQQLFEKVWTFNTIKLMENEVILTTHDGRIAQLPQQVVDKIAAGEVVVRPVNAVKELLENSLDAGATEIRVEISQGGLELIRIQDNGRGIARGDMPLVCSRFATSKLHAVEELRSIGTFGFRGEALASISIVADRVTITSKKFADKCAHRALYREGKMESDCTSVAGLQGTIISVDRLFQNAPARKAALRYPNEESNRIADLLVKYAIQFPSVSFAFRRISSSVGGGCGDFRSSGNGDQHGTIRTLLHAKMAKDLINVNFDDKILHFRAQICLTSPFTLFTSTAIQAKQDRQKVFHLFINGRCVECVRFKQAIDAVFAAKDAYCPFVNLSLEIEAHRVDVNVHPTKSIVHFLEQDRIIERIEQELHQIASQYHKRGAIELKVSNSNFGNDGDSQISGRVNDGLSNSPSFVASQQSSSQQSTRIHQKLLTTTTTPPSKTRIRVDTSNRSIDEFTEVITTPSGQGASAVDSPLRIQTQIAAGCCASSSFVSAVQMVPILTSFDSPPTQKTTQSEDNAPPMDVEHSQHNPSAPRHFELHALVQLRRQICLNADAELGKLFREHYLIGFYDAHHALIQSGASVFLLRSEPILQEFFYQLIIFSFGNIGSYALQSSAICGDVAGSPLPVRELLALYLTEEKEGMDMENDDIEARIEAFSKVLLEHKDLLWNFFSINIVDFSPEDKNQDISSMPMLGGLPCILEGYLPQMASIPALITHLARSVDYSDEGLCYSAIARALGHFFTPFVSDVEDGDEVLGEHQRIQAVFRSIIFPALKSRFLPPSSLWSSIERVTDIEQAFRHFGRC